MAAEFPEVSGKIAEMIAYRERVAAEFRKISTGIDIDICKQIGGPA